MVQLNTTNLENTKLSASNLKSVKANVFNSAPSNLMTSSLVHFNSNVTNTNEFNSNTSKSKQFKITIFILIILIITFNLFFFTKAHAETTNLKPTQTYVVDDYANILNQQFKDKIIQQEKIFQNTRQKPQIVVMTVKSTGNQNITDFANDLLSKQQWQFGQKSVDNGVLILFAQNNGKNNVYVSTGYGIKSLLSNLAMHNLFEVNAKLLNSNNDADINKGLENIFNNISQILTKQYANGNQPNASHNKFIIGGQTNRQRQLVIEVKPIYLAITFLVIIMITVLIKIGLISGKHDDIYQKQLYWYKHLSNNDLNYRFIRINIKHNYWSYTTNYDSSIFSLGDFSDR